MAAMVVSANISRLFVYQQMDKATIALDESFAATVVSQVDTLDAGLPQRLPQERWVAQRRTG